jgi:hypothetical protein
MGDANSSDRGGRGTALDGKRKTSREDKSCKSKITLPTVEGVVEEE